MTGGMFTSRKKEVLIYQVPLSEKYKKCSHGHFLSVMI